MTKLRLRSIVTAVAALASTSFATAAQAAGTGMPWEPPL